MPYYYFDSTALVKRYSMERGTRIVNKLMVKRGKVAILPMWSVTDFYSALSIRSQEHGYRAVALFRRAGGELPASAGVCGSLQLAELELHHAQTTLDQSNQAEKTDSLSPRLKALHQTTDDWTIVLGSMQAEFHCPS